MRLLFDQNVSFRIISKLADIFPEARQVRQLNIENYSDAEIWEFARQNNYTIVTFDADFFDLSSLKGHPPKIIWLRFGNSPTDLIAQVIYSKAQIIKDFVLDHNYREIACLEIK